LAGGWNKWGPSGKQAAANNDTIGIYLFRNTD
jgi:hypothetical protein